MQRHLDVGISESLKRAKGTPWGQDESRRRGTIQPHVTSTMFQDRRAGTLQLLSQGHPSILLGMCRDYWDGSAMSNLPATLRKNILDMHQQWSLEDLDVVAFAYTPVPYTVEPYLSVSSKHLDYLIHPGQASGKHRSRGMTSGAVHAAPRRTTGARRGPGDAVSTRSRNDIGDPGNHSHQDNATVGNQGEGNLQMSPARDECRREPDIPQQQSLCVQSMRDDPSAGDHGSKHLKEPRASGLFAGHSQASHSGIARDGSGAGDPEAETPGKGKGRTRRYSVDDFGDIPCRVQQDSAQETPAPACGESKMTEAIWNLLHEQVFLGMAASFVPPNRDIVALIEDVEAAGVRFVFFSPRNMRRSKALAESMGIDTDWNCAISLRPLQDSSQPDPHRMKSDYADWDVKARLPHGILSIREHIKHVDNVPLLVSLFTDSTPQATREMIGIYKEYHECVLAIGMSHRAVNADLFRAADLAVSVEGLPLNQPLSSLPTASKSQFSAIDAAFNNKLVGLHAALPLGDLVRRGDALGGIDDIGSIIIDLVREGRRLLANSYQALSFLVLVSVTAALLVLSSAALPISHPMTLGGDHLIWTLWLVAPLLAASFLAAPADGFLMKRTPEKNDPKVVPIPSRLDVHLLLRTVPTVLICLALYIVLMGKFLIIDNPELALLCAQKTEIELVTWMDMVWCAALEDASLTKSLMAASQARDLVLFELVLCLTVQSAGMMYRTASIRKERPWKNWVWTHAVVLVLLLQVVHLLVSGAARKTLPILFKCPWDPLVAGALCPWLVLLLGEIVKRDDARVYDRYVTLLRLEFDTRLGMHSPR